MEDWNKDKYQGRRKDQVDFSNKVTIISGAIFILLIIISTIINFKVYFLQTVAAPSDWTLLSL